MTPELWQRLKPLYEAALDVPEEQRAQFIAGACKDDPELQQHLEALLAGHDESAGSFDAPVVNLSDIFPRRHRTLADGEMLLGRFKIVRLLGSGGMGEVYEAEDQFLHSVHIALKTILPQVSGDPAAQKRFEREVLLAQEVTHPNLCPIHTIFHCDDPPPGYSFLTMKLLPGKTLAARLQDLPRMTEEEGLAVLRQASFGIAAIHEAGIIHRDIKPSNFIVDGSGSGLHLWITDFGLARACETESTVSSVGTVAGTPGYIAPELFLGHPPSQASDLFALGVVFHEVLTGQKPIPVPGTHSYTVSPRLTTPKVPPLCVHLVTEFLQDDPQRRSAAFAEVLETNDWKLEGRYYTRRSRQLWTRRRFAATAAVGVCAVAGGAWWKWDELENALHPLPRKRFVALLNWPRTSNSQLMPMLTAALSAIKSELSRFEAFDRDLFVISPEDIDAQLAQTNQLKDICDSLGANLVLGASALTVSSDFKLILRLLDPVSGHSLRERSIRTPLSAITSLPQKVVETATALFNLHHRLAASLNSTGPDTQSTVAFTAFQTAESLMTQPNDAGLDGAITQYKQAVELDPQYAIAHARLALAYCRLYAIRHDPGAIDLARGNSDHALSLNPGLVEGYLARAWVLEHTGNEKGALDQIAKALALDPSDPRTLIWQAQIYSRLNRWADAERTFKRVLDERPNFWLAHNELGVVFNSQGKYSDAIREFRAACLAAPGNSLAFNNVGAIYLQLGNFSEATENFKKSFSLKANALAAQNISSALRCQGKYRDALTFAEKAVELEPANDQNWLELADCYSLLPGRQREANDAYLRARTEMEKHLQIDATDGAGWMLLALYQIKSGNTSNALSLIHKATALGAEDMDSQLYKVRILELLGNRDEALTTLESCFRQGATSFEISSAPDLQSLQHDLRYQSLLKMYPASTGQKL